MVVIVWKSDLQLPMQSVPITNNVVSSNPAQTRCTRYNILLYVIKFISYLRQVDGFLLILLVSSTNKIDLHDIAEKLLKVALITIKPNQTNLSKANINFNELMILL